MTTAPAYHIPVLLKESVDALKVNPSGVYVDATLGGGGHTREILSRLGADGRLMVFDRDSDALANAPEDGRIIRVHNNFRFIHNFVQYHGFAGVDGILADLGVSSHQFDTPERGFSFRFDAGLDMRMNTLAEKSAAEVINTYEEKALERIFRLYGEVENSRRVAALICKARTDRPVESTSDLNAAIESVTPALAPHKYLAKIYQALRIEVNGEMRSLELFLNGALKSLNPDGVLSIITYHSLEDRMVKNFLKSGNIDGIDAKDIYGRRSTPLKLINRKPILPGESEIMSNTRARSAKLRAAVKEGV